MEIVSRIIESVELDIKPLYKLTCLNGQSSEVASVSVLKKFVESAYSEKEQTLRHTYIINSDPGDPAMGTERHIFATRNRQLYNLWSGYGGALSCLPLDFLDRMFAFYYGDINNTDTHSKLLAFGGVYDSLKPGKNSNGGGWIENIDGNWYYLAFTISSNNEEYDFFREFAEAINVRTLREIRQGYVYVLKKYNLDSMGRDASGMHEDLAHWKSKAKFDNTYLIRYLDPYNDRTVLEASCLVVIRGWNRAIKKLDYVVAVDVETAHTFIIVRDVAVYTAFPDGHLKWLSNTFERIFKRCLSFVFWASSNHILNRIGKVGRVRVFGSEWTSYLEAQSSALVKFNDHVKSFDARMTGVEKSIEEVKESIEDIFAKVDRLLAELDKD